MAKTWETFSVHAERVFIAVGREPGQFEVSYCWQDDANGKYHSRDIVCDQLRDKALLPLHHVVARMIGAGLHVPEDVVRLEYRCEEWGTLEISSARPD